MTCTEVICGLAVEVYTFSKKSLTTKCGSKNGVPIVPCELIVEEINPGGGAIDNYNGCIHYHEDSMGTIWVYSPTSISVSSDNPNVRITGCISQYSHSYLISYSVVAHAGCANQKSTISIKQNGAYNCIKKVYICSFGDYC
jgi:hypothetical protein